MFEFEYYLSFTDCKEEWYNRLSKFSTIKIKVPVNRFIINIA